MMFLLQGVGPDDRDPEEQSVERARDVRLTRRAVAKAQVDAGSGVTANKWNTPGFDPTPELG
jgi:hypothetical protein